MNWQQKERFEHLEKLTRKFTVEELAEYLQLLEVVDPLHSDASEDEDADTDPDREAETDVSTYITV
jgi:hypothetical protein